jgi:hypothetical protein
VTKATAITRIVPLSRSARFAASAEAVTSRFLHDGRVEDKHPQY